MRFVKYGDDMTTTEGVGVAATHGTRIRKESFPNLGQDIAYSSGISLAFLRSSKQILGQCCDLTTTAYFQIFPKSSI
jgi:hypothetical protein